MTTITFPSTDAVLSARTWRELGVPHTDHALRHLQRRLHPDLCADTHAADAFAKLMVLWKENVEFSRRLARGRRVGDQTIRWEVADGDADLAAAVLSAADDIGGSMFVTTPELVDSTVIDVTYGIGEGRWWFLSDFDADALVGEHAVWVFKRLLAAITVIGGAGLSHGDVSAHNIVINPDEHGLQLDGFWGSVPLGSPLLVRPDAVTPAAYLRGAGTTPNMSVAQAASTVLNSFEVSPSFKRMLRELTLRPTTPTTAFESAVAAASADFGRAKWVEMTPPSTPSL